MSDASIARLSNLAEVKQSGGKIPAHMIDAFAARTVYASTIPGVVLDCDIYGGGKVGGGTPTDNATRINAVLAAATATNPVHLIIDGGCAMGAALVIPATGYVTITGMGWNTGFFWLSGSNCNCIQTGNYGTTDLSRFNAVHPPSAQSITGRHVRLANFFVNGNRGSFPNGIVGNYAGDGTMPASTGLSSSPGADARGFNNWFWLSAVGIVGIQDLSIDQLYVYNAATYHIDIYHCQHVRIAGCRIDAGQATSGTNQDGIHLNGSCSDVRISHCHIVSGDDAFALNLHEGDHGSGGDIIISDCVVNSLTLGRVYGFQSSILDRVTFSNITGTVRWWGLLIGEGNSFADNVGVESNRSVLLDGVTLKVTAGDGPLPPALVIVSANTGLLELNRVKVSDPTVAHPFVLMGNLNSAVSALRVTNCGVHRTEAGSAAVPLIVANHAGSSIGDLVVSGFHVTEQAGHTYSDIPTLCNVAGTAVARMTVGGNLKGVATVVNATTLGSLDIADLVHISNAGSPTAYTVASGGSPCPVSVGRYRGVNLVGLATGSVALSGPGLVASGFALADAAVANSSLYYSATAAALSYKDGSGTVNAFNFAAQGPASAYALTGPTSGNTGSASSSFTVRPNGVYTGTITITPSGGGLSTPIVKTFSGSSAAQTFAITPTSVGTVTLTGSNNGSLSNPSALSYVASAPGVAVYLHDTFTGTAGMTLKDQQAAPTNNGSDTWYNPFPTYNGALAYVNGGGVTSSAMGSNNYATEQYNLTGASVNQTATLRFSSAVAGGAAQWIMHRNDSSPHGITYVFDLANGAYTIGQNDTTGADHVVGTGSVSLAHDGTVHTLVATLIGSALTVKLDGTPLGASPFSVQSMTGTQCWLMQNGGSPGDVVFKEVTVAQAAATLTGPTSGTAGSASTGFTVTLDGAAPAGGQAVTLASSAGGTTFAGTNVSGTTLTIPAGQTAGTFTYNRAGAGTSNISITSTGLAVGGSPIAYIAS